MYRRANGPDICWETDTFEINPATRRQCHSKTSTAAFAKNTISKLRNGTFGIEVINDPAAKQMAGPLALEAVGSPTYPGLQPGLGKSLGRWPEPNSSYFIGALRLPSNKSLATTGAICCVFWVPPISSGRYLRRDV